MTQTYTWKGAAYQNWFTPTNWTPSGPPTGGSVAVIKKNAGPQINADGTVDDVGIVFGGANAAITMDGGTIGAGVSIIDAGNYDTDLQVLASSAFNGNFTFAPTVTNGQVSIYGTAGERLTIGQSGTLTAPTGTGIILSTVTVTNNGTLNAAGGLVSAYSSALDGTGVVNISHGGLFFTNKDIGAGETISFKDQTGLIDVYSGATIAGPITNMQAGDAMNVDVVADTASYDVATHTLALTDQGTTVATFNVFSSGGPLSFAAALGRYGETVITTSDATRVWNGGTADWYDAANWTSTPGGFPLAGDTVRIGSGMATVSAADVLQYGTIDFTDIILSGDSGAPGTLLLPNETIGPNATLESTGTNQAGVLEIDGNVTLNGNIVSQANGGGLSIDLLGGATFVNGTAADVLTGSASTLDVGGTGTFINNGIVVVQGGFVIGSGVTFTATAANSGSNELIRLQNGGNLTVDGLIKSNTVEFADATAVLTIDNLANFTSSSAITNFDKGNRIYLPNQVVTAVNYNSGELHLINAGTAVGSLTVYTSDGFAGFHVAPANGGGSVITYEPKVHLLEPALPVPLVAAPGATDTLDDLLIQAFGTIPAAFTNAQFGLSFMTRADLADWDFSYWSLPGTVVTHWILNGATVGAMPSNSYWPPNPPVRTVAGTLAAGITLQAGYQIAPNAILEIPIGGTGTNAARAAFYVTTVDPNVASPTIYSGVVNPADIVASAERFADYYGSVRNDNDCGWIGDDVAAAAGATMPSNNQSTDPTANVSGGFWRVVYRGSDQVNPVQDWSTLVAPGDIVRMGWTGGGQHTTTVLAVNGDGSIKVYDNDDWLPAATTSVIGIHDATYWTATVPASITIYRLDSNHQFLVAGAGAEEFLQGSTYNNLFEPIGGSNTIATGVAHDEIQGTAADITGSSILAWQSGDSIDVTDLAFAGAAASYDPASGLLTVSNMSSGVQAAVSLPTGLGFDFSLQSDASGTGTLVNTIPGSVPCFATGTRLRTPSGDVPVERLCVGDRVLTHTGIARPIRWIGRRTIDLRCHPRPRDVQPVRIAPHAFGPQRPQRALMLSPDHALYFDGVLIPVRYLVDGEQIAQLQRRSVTYWHVELDRHDAVLAENLPAESYLRVGVCTEMVWETEACGPLIVTGPNVHAARAGLLAASP